MLLKRLFLKNIRTYEQWQIDFPSGTILFEGGIGSGKSTLLLAVEFALFGLGNERGTTLLGLGKNLGEVELEFEAMGRNVKVHRSLVRTKKGTGVNQGALVAGGVKQDECWVEADGRKTSYSPKEMKEAVLKILNYNEPSDPKAKSVIFRYAVYTPQEEMKEILAQPTDQRLQTIRKALRLEEYKVAQDNAHTVSRELSSRSRFLMEETKKLPGIDDERKALDSDIPKLKQRLAEWDEKITDVQVEIKGHRADEETLRAALTELLVEVRAVEELARARRENESRSSTLKSGLVSKREKVRVLRLRHDEKVSSQKKPSMSKEEAEERLSEAKARLAGCMEELGQTNQISRNYSKLIESQVCPTCNQPVDGREYRNRLDEIRRRNEEIVRARRIAEQDQVRYEGERDLAIAYETSAKEIAEMEDRIYDNEEQIARDEEELGKIEAQRTNLERRESSAAAAASKYKALKAEYDVNIKKIESLEDSEEGLKRERNRTELELERKLDRLKELEVKRKEIEGIKDRADRLNEYVGWLDGYFSLALERIERSILISANRELDEDLGRLFAFLVEDPTKSVRIDEAFTPIVTQDAYEQEVTNLSGGERTALALAYRLALNRTVQRRAGGSSGLLILDEPTDGFSKDQIAKMGDLLKELKLQQTIIVSHERELEGAVDHIFRVSKEEGRSKVVQVLS
jgi:exonuclease SbcC